MRYSRAVSGIQEAISIKYNSLVYELQRQGKSVIVLSLGEAFFDLPLFSFDTLPAHKINHYSHSRGLHELREKVASYYENAHATSIDPASELIVTAGSKAAVQMAFMTILDPDDEVLVPEPGWVSYTEQIKLCGGQPIGVPLQASTFDFEDYITERTRAIVINTPHNPRGHVYSAAELSYLLELAERHDLWLLCDEAYSDFVTDGSFVSLGRIDPTKQRAVVFNSISKNFGLSGWRLGYVIARREFIDQFLKVNQHLITCPPTILSYYLAEHFEELLEITRPQIEAVVQKRAAVARLLDLKGLSYLPGNATFYFFVSIAPTLLSSEQFATRLLREHFVSVVPGIGYGRSCDGYVRVSIGTASLENIEQGLECIARLIRETSQSVRRAA